MARRGPHDTRVFANSLPFYKGSTGNLFSGAKTKKFLIFLVIRRNNGSKYHSYFRYNGKSIKINNSLILILNNSSKLPFIMHMNHIHNHSIDFEGTPVKIKRKRNIFAQKV